MKFYKFRKLTSELDYYRLKEIIENNDFWCSSFWELNDPMEGVFSIDTKLAEKISEIHGEKGQYKICSFSGKRAFENPIMWGYYADGFKGVAIEIDLSEEKLKKIKYSDSAMEFDSSSVLDDNVEKILLNKNTAWEHEDEYRYLEKQNDNYFKVEKINAVYFGTPYENLENSEDILKNRESFNRYKKFKEKIIEIIKIKKITFKDVSASEGGVKTVQGHNRL